MYSRICIAINSNKKAIYVKGRGSQSAKCLPTNKKEKANIKKQKPNSGAKPKKIIQRAAAKCY